MSKVKEITKTQKRKLVETNVARLDLGFKPIKIVVKSCNLCTHLFESVGNINCGCNKQARERTAIFCGRDCV